MNIEEMRQIKKNKHFSYRKLSELSGVPVGTMQKIFRGETESPRYETLEALEKALTGYSESPSADVVRESPPAYGSAPLEKQQGSYTLEDYYALPDDKRYELIDGYLFEINAPTSFHQLLAGEVHRQIANFIIDHNGDCTPFISPIDVQLDRDDRTMIQPDVIIMCDSDQITSKHIVGAPDFVLEVLSPGTKKRDLNLKLRKYEQAGVREYWVVDPYQRVVLCYFFESSEYMTIYPINESIPVHIYNCELKINLTRMLKWLPDKNSSED